jgi:hypothetical protein
MSCTAAQLLEEIRQLPPDQRQWLVESLLADADQREQAEAFAAMDLALGAPESVEDRAFHAKVEEAMNDTSGDVPHAEAMAFFHQAIVNAQRKAVV